MHISKHFKCSDITLQHNVLCFYNGYLASLYALSYNLESQRIIIISNWQNID